MEKQQKLYRNGIKVDNLYRAIRDSQAIENIPKFVKQIIEDDMWREHLYEKTGETFTFESFQKFVETHPPDGLGTTVEMLFKLCVDAPEVMDLIDQTLLNDAGSADKEQPKPRKPPISSARQAGLRKLRLYAEQNKQIATLRDAVLKGEMSVNAALVSAGLRKKRFSIPEDVAGATKSLRKRYNQEELRELVKLLNNENN
jgi:hypothetical protein